MAALTGAVDDAPVAGDDGGYATAFNTPLQITAAELLAKTPKPSRDQIVAHMNGNICRCGTYNRIVAAIQRASREG